MGLRRDKFRNIVGGITSQPEDEPETAAAPPPAEQGSVADDSDSPVEPSPASDTRRFAKRGRPKGSKTEPADKGRKVKVSLFLSEVIVNDLYEWAHDDKIHPGTMFERALKPFHEKEEKRRKAGKE
ncbi:hypothetical protein [Singulisphaera acidiphila]|uniref:Uncharacterized protein n=1 Tax=Singulisphaera acidiphila (strain ATCC BAA-1392 / DSM 18658 / VKM B-2454 / MOB10) TaxID=886293 RepID=L0DRT8_SINAD|nr:hypothetical protein [Singulisphaera acidiphila]AGA31697.1 hypothetical protein Sinac_7668 [Singulisphaera acidiphila DSM 18658]